MDAMSLLEELFLQNPDACLKLLQGRNTAQNLTRSAEQGPSMSAFDDKKGSSNVSLPSKTATFVGSTANQGEVRDF